MASLISLELIHRQLPKDCCLRKPWNINLPDCDQGYALMVIEEGKFALETFSRGVKLT
jgi:hypothetical protein